MLTQVCACTYPLQFSAVRLHCPLTLGSLKPRARLLVGRRDLAPILGEYLDRDHRFFLLNLPLADICAYSRLQVYRLSTKQDRRLFIHDSEAGGGVLSAEYHLLTEMVVAY